MDWSDRFSINQDEIDAQHKKLFQMLTKLEASLARGIVGPEIGEVLKELVGYTTYHFTSEESYMEQIGFHELAEHKALHKKLIGQVTRILLDIRAGQDFTALNLIDFLKHWLWDHILKEDKKITLSQE